MNKVLLILGTRPEAIKVCPLILRLKRESKRFRPIVCSTGQHREMLQPVLRTFGVTPDHDLDVMTSNQSLAGLAAECIKRVAEVIELEKPDMVIIQGDTTTAFAASLAAYYQRVAVAHMEAGLRTFDKYSPFPEEINRRLADAMADMHFAPTVYARKNLLTEGIPEERIWVTGNTAVDALLWVRKKIRNENKEYAELKGIDFGKKVILVTGHRRESFGKPFTAICKGIRAIACRNQDCEIVYPVHLNPNVKTTVKAILDGIANVKLVEPLEYETFVYLMDRCHFIISDSGGIQEEAPYIAKPVLVTREVTERPEGVRAGAATLVGSSEERIVEEAERLLRDHAHYRRMARIRKPYGDGNACGMIVKAMIYFLSMRNQKDCVPKYALSHTTV